MKLTDFGVNHHKLLEDFNKFRPQLPPEQHNVEGGKQADSKPIKDEFAIGTREPDQPFLERPILEGRVYRKANMGERLETLKNPNAPLGGNYVLMEPDREALNVASSRAVPGDHTPTERSKPEVESVRLIKNSDPTINGEEWLLSRPKMG